MLKIALRPDIVKRSVLVALVVGTILNLINQGDAVMGDEHIDTMKCVLTYIVPYLVSTYGAVSVLTDNKNSKE